VICGSNNDKGHTFRRIVIQGRSSLIFVWTPPWVKLRGSCNLWTTFLSLVVLNIFVSNLQFKFIIDGQTFVLIAGLYTCIYIYHGYFQTTLSFKKIMAALRFLMR
jgi:hypothetical protein